ncbi:hypothetical protein, partial [Streptomyces sp. NPDC002550]
PATKAPPSTSSSPGQEDKSAWALEVALDVETAHAMASGANILLVTTQHRDKLLVGHGHRLPGLGTLDRLHGLQLHGGISHLASSRDRRIRR